MGEHLINGEFQSDKYPWCRRGFVPLKITDPMAQPVLWEYAQVRRTVDAEFSDDLCEALRLAGYQPPDLAVSDLLAACTPFADAPDYSGFPDDAVVLPDVDKGFYITAGQVRAIKAAMGRATEGASE